MSAEGIIVLFTILFLFLCGAYYRKLSEKEKKIYRINDKHILLLLLASPVIWLGLFAGKGWYKGTGIFTLVLLLLVWFQGFFGKLYQERATELKCQLLAYMMVMLSFSGVMAYGILPEPIDGMKTVRVISVFLLAWSLGEGIRLFLRRRKNRLVIGARESETEEEQENIVGTAAVSKGIAVAVEAFGSGQLLALLGIILCYGLVTFIGLGSWQMPQTAMEIRPDEKGSHEIILDLGSEQKLDSVYIHLGHILDRITAVSYYDEAKKQWIPLQEEVELESNYNWNEVIIDQDIRYLGIVSRSGKAVFHEIVLLGPTGERLLPVNAEAYELLFDEQDLFPEEITYFHRTMFDEVYYAGSAYEFLNGMNMFESTHPPMGKILIAAGEWLFGVNPFGWRFTCALFGLLMLPLMCWFLYRMFRNSTVALIATALLSLDFMHFTLSRIATLDSIIAFFILGIFAVMWRVLDRAREEIEQEKKRPSAGLIFTMLVCAFMVGMGVATKWTGFYAMAGAAVCFLWFIGYWIWSLKKQGKAISYLGWMLGEGILIFGLLPLGIYVLSFLPQSLATGRDNVWKVMWDSSLFMLNFHSDIVFEHPYESPWYTWPWIKTPLVDAANILKDGRSSIIVTMGNPIIWWSGIGALFHMLYRALFQKDRKAGYLTAAYLFMLVPWFFVKRTVFIYQYYGSSIFMIGMLAYSLYLLGQKRKKLIPIFLEAALFIFILFYPIISGYSINGHHIVIYLEWLKSWNFAWI